MAAVNAIDALMREELVARLRAAFDGITKARSRLNDAQPGYPTSTPGAGPESSSRSIDGARCLHPGCILTRPCMAHDPRKLTAVERQAGRPDEARDTLARINRLERGLVDPITELYSSVHMWNFDPARPTIDTATDHIWCVNHLRIDACEPRHRGTLCRWCDDTRRTFGYTPTVALMELRAQGARLTEKLYRAHNPVAIKKKKRGRKSG